MINRVRLGRLGIAFEGAVFACFSCMESFYILVGLGFGGGGAFFTWSGSSMAFDTRGFQGACTKMMVVYQKKFQFSWSLLFNFFFFLQLESFELTNSWLSNMGLQFLSSLPGCRDTGPPRCTILDMEKLKNPIYCL